MSGKLEDTVAISREITHGYYAGNFEPYLSRLCSKSVWLGTGGRILIGGWRPVRSGERRPIRFFKRSTPPCPSPPAVRR